ncbi:hypothetical protein U9M48_030902 [Paspalum notatum var. saurae]|uniref:RING-type domain-containing protein n=1 Tax=Paspalum notatum var. saurae TaxID=547442 RepID=A0AAQ3X355_PASNO
MSSAGDVVGVVVCLVGMILFSAFLDYLCSSMAEPQEAGAATSRRRAPPSDGHRRRVPPSNGDRVVPRPQPAPPVTTVEMAARTKKEPLVCTYRRAHGWPAATCAVCLAELEDGVNIRVLRVCKHYFHASCVSEWLLEHKTCPLCRAPLDPVADAASPPSDDDMYYST